MVQTFLEEKQSSYPAIAVLKRTDVLKSIRYSSRFTFTW